MKKYFEIRQYNGDFKDLGEPVKYVEADNIEQVEEHFSLTTGYERASEITEERYHHLREQLLSKARKLNDLAELYVIIEKKT